MSLVTVTPIRGPDKIYNGHRTLPTLSSGQLRLELSGIAHSSASRAVGLRRLIDRLVDGPGWNPHMGTKCEARL